MEDPTNGTTLTLCADIDSDLSFVDILDCAALPSVSESASESDSKSESSSSANGSSLVAGYGFRTVAGPWYLFGRSISVLLVGVRGGATHGIAPYGAGFIIVTSAMEL